MILEIFYDESCPFCVRCAEWIKKNDVNKDILLSDVSKEMFMLELLGVHSEDANKNVHAVFRNGEVIKGAAVVRAILDIFGHTGKLGFINLPVVSWIFDKLWSVVSNNRHRIGW